MINKSIEAFNPKDFIIIKGAKTHNLKNIDVAIPRNKFVVITGLSGSGKSSLAFDTLYAEGQRRYVESLSSYARQFLGKIQKPDVEYIKGVAPAIAIEQKVNSTNSRSTVGTVTEVYDYLKLLFARIGETYSPKSGKKITRDSPKSVTEFILSQAIGSKIYIVVSKSINSDTTNPKELLLQQGYSRAIANEEVVWIEDLDFNSLQSIDIVIDRFIINESTEDDYNRIYDSVTTAYFEGFNQCKVMTDSGKSLITHSFDNQFSEEGVEFIEPSLNLFSFNNPLGACQKCEGFGKVIGIDEDLVIPNRALSVYQDAVVPWKSESAQEWKSQLIKNATKADFPIHKPIHELNPKQLDQLWNGTPFFEGIHDYFDYVSSKSYKIQYRVMLARYRGKTTCPSCKGTRIRKEATYVKIDQHSIADLVLMSIQNVKAFFDAIQLSDHQFKIAERILKEINNRLDYLCNVGVGYLSLNRSAASLSGGESQRINLATSLGSSLVGSMYILDEPSIGLHSKDTEKLIQILKSLKEVGNTVIVVEHDEDIIRQADVVIDLGPEAGHLGGELIFQGTQKDLQSADSLTAKYLNKVLSLDRDKTSRKWNHSIQISGIRENNLKGINVEIPLNVMTVISGVSGSGKSTLVKTVLLPAIQKEFGIYGDKNGQFTELKGDLNQIQDIQFIDQNPIGKSSRSNPVTYVKAYDEIRNLFASIGLSKNRNYKPSHFSFNVEGGRCEVCQGEGVITEEMQFMADVHLTCEECNGKRFKEEILEVKFHEKNIADVLEMTIQEAIEFFDEKEQPLAIKIANKLRPLFEVGLGYVHLGQASSTLSGGEAQRIKLATYLGKGSSSKKILFIFDEPTTGLHFHDIAKLLNSFDQLIKKGHSLLIIEHNLEVIRHADWNIDLGPEGGDKGGQLMFQGAFEDFKVAKASVTQHYL